MFIDACAVFLLNGNGGVYTPQESDKNSKQKGLKDHENIGQNESETDIDSIAFGVRSFFYRGIR